MEDSPKERGGIKDMAARPRPNDYLYSTDMPLTVQSSAGILQCDPDACRAIALD